MLWRKGILKLIQLSSSTFVTTQSYGGSFLSRSVCGGSDSGRQFAALWGNGDYGRLGLGSLESKWTPAICSFLDDDDIPLSIACGGAHTLFLTEKGRVFSSGFNNFGQLGTQPGTTHTLEPHEIVGFPNSVVKISAGYYHSAAITKDGKLFMWGRNSSGQLGLGKKSSSIVSKPARVDSLVDFHIEGVALGSDHTIAITDKGQVLSWGDGGFGKLGHGFHYGILGFTKGLSGSNRHPQPTICERQRTKKNLWILQWILILEDEMVYDFERRGTPRRCFLSIELRKTFDTIKWEAITNTLESMGFSPGPCSIVHNCISIACFPILFEGSPHPPNQSKRNKTRGPLSSILFDMVMDNLSILIEKGVRDNKLDTHSQWSHLYLTPLFKDLCR